MVDATADKAYDGLVDEEPSRRPFSYGIVAALIIGALVLGAGYQYMRARGNKQMVDNFNLQYPRPPVGWKTKPHSPMDLFAYEDEHRGLTLSGGVNQTVADFNPTPDLDRDNLAQLMIDNTRANMPGWTAKIEDLVNTPSASFRLVRRETPGLVNVTAFAVKGNTTVLISLVGRGKQSGEVDKAMKEFHDFVAQIELKRADTRGW